MNKGELIAQADLLFEQNGIKGGMIHNFFHECTDGSSPHLQPVSFYIDDRVPFKGIRKLESILSQLQKLYQKN